MRKQQAEQLVKFRESRPVSHFKFRHMCNEINDANSAKAGQLAIIYSNLIKLLVLKISDTIT